LNIYGQTLIGEKKREREREREKLMVVCDFLFLIYFRFILDFFVQYPKKRQLLILKKVVEVSESESISSLEHFYWCIINFFHL